MVPELPTAGIRSAIAACDWPRAIELIAVHQRELMVALGSVDRATMDQAPWIDLLLAQRALLAEVRVARNQAADALAQLSEDHRGARAWLRELA